MERTMLAMGTAHIKPFSLSGTNVINNGTIFRKDFHALFDKGYLTVTPTLNIEVSRKIKEEFENGHEYYVYHGRKINLPSKENYRPSIDNLKWHNENLFRG